MNNIKRTFTLDIEILILLISLARTERKSMSQMVRDAIRYYALKVDGSKRFLLIDQFNQEVKDLDLSQSVKFIW